MLDKNSSLRIILRLAAYWLQHGWRLAGTESAMIGGILLSLAIPRLLGSAIDEAVGTGVHSRITLVAGTIVAVALVRGVLGYLDEYLFEQISQRIAHDIRNELFQKLQNLSFGFHDKQQTGNLMSRATADVDAIQYTGIFHAINVMVFLGAVGSLMVATNWRLGAICLAFVLVALWRSFSVIPRMVHNYREAQSETGHMTTVVQQALAGMRVVKAFGGRRYERARFEERAASVRTHMTAASLMSTSRRALSTLILNIAVGTILWVGAREVASGRLTAGDVAAFLLYMGMLAEQVLWAGFMVTAFTRAAAAGKRIFEVLDAESPVKERSDAQVMPRLQGHVRFEGVSLAYDAAVPAVRNLDFEVAPGQLVAILGAPGSGKSTLVHLIPRFYDVSEGRVLMDGVDVRDATIDSVRQNVGIVLQDSLAFAATIKDNIEYGVDDASVDDVVRAAKVAQLQDWVEGLKDGYDTWVGERGITLSGGQQQRLAIARTLLLDPPILILDDSTSSVDVGTEYQIQRALAEVVKGRTTFVIAHRLSTVRNADLVLVLDDGEIVERGAHDELLALNGRYRQIHDLQLQDETAWPAPTLESPV